MDAHLLQRPPVGRIRKIGVRARFIAQQLRNDSQRALGYNLCTSSLERRIGQAWQQVPSQRICTMELRSLTPGEEARYSIALTGLPPGEYRATTRVEGLPAAVTTEPFQLR